MSLSAKIRHKIILYTKGLGMGVADIIPGVSGGTIALITGIYEELVEALGSFQAHHLYCLFHVFSSDNEKKQSSRADLKALPWNFLLPLVAGILTAVLIMARIIPWFITHYPAYTFSVFFGLILFSTPIPFRLTEKRPVDFAIAAVFAAGTFFLVGDPAALQLQPSLPYLFLCGMLAISAWILPGISGAYILVLLGTYQTVLDALHERDIQLLAVFIAGIITGILAFIRLLKVLLHHAHSLTMAAMAGFMLGSLRKLYPLQYLPENTASTAYVLIVICIAAGGLISWAGDRITREYDN